MKNRYRVVYTGGCIGDTWEDETQVEAEDLDELLVELKKIEYHPLIMPEDHIPTVVIKVELIS